MTAALVPQMQQDALLPTLLAPCFLLIGGVL